MAGIIDFPTVVQEALQQFGDLLPNEPQRRHLAEYLWEHNDYPPAARLMISQLTLDDIDLARRWDADKEKNGQEKNKRAAR